MPKSRNNLDRFHSNHEGFCVGTLENCKNIQIISMPKRNILLNALLKNELKMHSMYFGKTQFAWTVYQLT